jgi:hypothetical protein
MKMMISNFECISNIRSFLSPIGKYLETHGFPVLGMKGNLYIFSNTKELQEALLNLPFYLKPFAKGGG